MQRLSIIVPLMGDLKRFEDTLVSVLENQPVRSEVVVVLNRPYDDPYELRGEVEFVEAPAAASLLECFACGLAASHAPIVHVIAAGIEAVPGWADSALARFSDEDVAAVAPVVIDRNNPQQILSSGLRYTSAGTIDRIAAGKRLDRFAADERALCGPELLSAFYRRDALETIESLPNSGSEMAAAVELALALRNAGYRCVQEPGCLATATSDVIVTGGAWREGAARERLFRRWATLPGGRRSWLGHIAMIALECAQIPVRPSRIGRLAGRLWVTLRGGAPRRVLIGPQSSLSMQGAVIRPPKAEAAELAVPRTRAVG